MVTQIFVAMPFSQLREFALTALVGAGGALIAAMIGFPAPYLIGPALAVSLAGIAGLTLSIPKIVRNGCFIVIGISMGATVTPDILVAIKRWPLSFVMVMVTVTALLYVAAWVMQRFFHYDRTTAFLAASPGHLSYVLSLAADMRCDQRTVGISQSVRVLLLTISVPMIVTAFDLGGGDSVAQVIAMDLPMLLGILAVSTVIGMLFLRWKLPAALLLAGTLVSISTHVTSFATGGVPSWLIVPVYILLGANIGTRFCGISLLEVRTALVSGLVVTVIVSVMAAAMAGTVSYVLDIPLDAALIAFSPGGLETMAAMAVMLHADPTYVGAHHVLRLIFLSILMPFALGRDETGPGKSATGVEDRRDL